MIPIYINNFNRLAWVQDMVQYLEDVPDVEPVIVDNDSTYPPLLQWYRKCPVRVERLAVNGGPRAIWQSHIDLEVGDYFALTDPDLDLSTVPIDFVAVLISGLERYPNIKKCGLSLEIDDLPDAAPDASRARQHESKFWTNRVDDQFWMANIATTMAVYRASRYCATYGPALRADRPYTARHRPWYLADDAITDEDVFYLKSIERQRTLSWSPIARKRYGITR